MRSKSLAVLGTCLLVTDCTEHGTPESQAEAAHQQELIAGAPMTANGGSYAWGAFGAWAWETVRPTTRS
jgi:hypothetical protein